MDNIRIEINNYSKIIKGTRVLNGINYTFTGGNVYGLTGKNGCGKTMLLRAIAGLIYATEGSVIINNQILGKDISFPESIGILIENPHFLRQYTGFENLRMLADIQGGISDEHICNVLDKVGLDSCDKRKVYKYSLGMRQRLGIAASILGTPDIILLDEPINAIDEGGVSQMRTVIRDLVSPDRIIIVACHDMDELKILADKIVYMNEGTIREDK